MEDFLVRALQRASNSTEPQQPRPVQHSSHDNTYEFIAFLMWYLFLILCCVVPTCCAYRRRRRLEHRMAAAVARNHQQTLERWHRQSHILSNFIGNSTDDPSSTLASASNAHRKAKLHEKLKETTFTVEGKSMQKLESQSGGLATGSADDDLEPKDTQTKNTDQVVAETADAENDTMDDIYAYEEENYRLDLPKSASSPSDHDDDVLPRSVPGTCAICLGLYAEGEQVTWSSSASSMCPHAFHTDCITNWLLKQPSHSPTCPVCRQDFCEPVQREDPMSAWSSLWTGAPIRLQFLESSNERGGIGDSVDGAVLPMASGIGDWRNLSTTNILNNSADISSSNNNNNGSSNATVSAVLPSYVSMTSTENGMLITVMRTPDGVSSDNDAQSGAVDLGVAAGSDGSVEQNQEADGDDDEPDIEMAEQSQSPNAVGTADNEDP